MDILQPRTSLCPLSLVTFSFLFQSLWIIQVTQNKLPSHVSRWSLNLIWICPQIEGQGPQTLLSESSLASSLRFLGSKWLFSLLKRTPLHCHVENHWPTTENIHKCNYKGSCLKPEQTPRSCPGPSCGWHLFNPGSHVTSNHGHGALGLNFTQVNPLL